MITNVKLSTNNSSAAQNMALAVAGMDLEIDATVQTAYAKLWTLLTGKDIPENFEIYKVFKTRLYLPTVYQRGGKPCLLWNGEVISLDDAPQNVSITYAAGNTGYPGLVASLLWTEEKNLKGAKEVFSGAFPVRLKAEEEALSEFISLHAVDPEEAFSSYVQAPNPLMGMSYLDDYIQSAHADDLPASLEVMVFDVVESEGQYGPYKTVTCEFPVGSGQMFKLRPNSQMRDMLGARLAFPLKVKGEVKMAKKHYNLTSLELTRENFILG